MTIKAKNLVPSAMLTATAATYYTVAASTKAIVQKLTIANTDTVARTVTVYFVPSGGTASATNAIVSAYAVPAGFTAELSAEACGHVLEAGDTIQALASTASVLSIRCSGVEIV